MARMIEILVDTAVNELVKSTRFTGADIREAIDRVLLYGGNVDVAKAMITSIDKMEDFELLPMVDSTIRRSEIIRKLMKTK